MSEQHVDDAPKVMGAFASSIAAIHEFHSHELYQLAGDLELRGESATAVAYVRTIARRSAERGRKIRAKTALDDALDAQAEVQKQVA